MIKNKLFFEQNNRFGYLYIESKEELDLEKLEKIVDYDYLKVSSPNNKKFTKDLIEIGPLNNFQSAWSSNAQEILKKCNFRINKIEKSDLLEDTNYIDTLLTNTNPPENYYFQKNEIKIEKPKNINLKDLDIYNQQNYLGFDEQDINHYINVFQKENRQDLSEVELFDLSQSNSEHSRHWFFKGIYELPDNTIDNLSLFDLVRDTLSTKTKKNSVLSFCDNASAISGYTVQYLNSSIKSNLDFQEYNYQEYDFQKIKLDISYTAETHNFPTGISPFPGAATGVGGRIRDTIAIGKGGLPVAGIAGYSVGCLINNPLKKPNDDGILPPEQILMQASNGASDYGNKFGEPLICGYTRSYGIELNQERIEYLKPIMFSGGIGIIPSKDIKKDKPQINQFIVRLGGPAYRIGIGGGSASSRSQETDNKELDRIAVQRGDPEMENRLVKLLKKLVESSIQNISLIRSIHDQGAGGVGNVVKEIVSPLGGTVDISKISLGDKTLTSKELWSSEFQESVVILINPSDLKQIQEISKIENVFCDVLGTVNNSNHIKVYDTRIESNYKDQKILDFNLDTVLENLPRKKYKFKNIDYNLDPVNILTNNIELILSEVISHPTVCSKRFLTNKVDRSVSGLVAKQQCVGPLQMPINNYGLISLDYNDVKGTVIAIGEQPIKGLINPEAMARLTVMEMITNMMWVKISDISDIKCSANWMWSIKKPGEDYRLYRAAKALTSFLKDLNIGIDGGKDSLSMKVQTKEKQDISAPGTLVLSGYCTVPDITKAITPCLKPSTHNSSHNSNPTLNQTTTIFYIDFNQFENFELGGTIFATIMENQLGDKSNDINPESILYIKTIFDTIQTWIDEGLILSGHDISDGGLITSLIEMSISGNIGLDIYLSEKILNKSSVLQVLFSESPGILFQVENYNLTKIISYLEDRTIKYELIAETNETKNVSINYKYTSSTKYNNLYTRPIELIRYEYERTSLFLETMQASKETCKQEMSHLISKKSNYTENEINYKTNLTNRDINIYPSILKQSSLNISNNIICGVIREEGSNGEKEMAAAFRQVGFQVLDLPMNLLLSLSADALINLEEKLSCIAFVGGFSYSDVFGASTGWTSIINNNTKIKNFFKKFYNNKKKKLSLGICNGCQLMIKLGIIKHVKLQENDSKRFESRFSLLKIKNKYHNIITNSNSNLISDIESKPYSPWLNKLDDSNLGIWTAHGEGKFVITSPEHFEKESNIVMNYIHPVSNQIEPNYPFNPNGSDKNMAAVTDKSGCHLAIMPHPERAFLTWQWPDYPNDKLPTNKQNHTPWIKLFKNAYDYCFDLNK